MNTKLSIEEGLYLKPFVEHARLNSIDLTKVLIKYRLQSTDWTQLPDSQVDRQSWSVYRQSLRDMLSQDLSGDVQWPAAPQ